MSGLWAREPVLILAVVEAVIAVAVVFGLGLPTGADTAIVALAGAVLAVFARSQVTSPATAARARASN